MVLGVRGERRGGKKDAEMIGATAVAVYGMVDGGRWQ